MTLWGGALVVRACEERGFGGAVGCREEREASLQVPQQEVAQERHLVVRVRLVFRFAFCVGVLALEFCVVCVGRCSWTGWSRV